MSEINFGGVRMCCSICGSTFHKSGACPKRFDVEINEKDSGKPPNQDDPRKSIQAMGICPECGTTLIPNHVCRHG